MSFGMARMAAGSLRAAEPLSTVFVLNSLDTGGAERQVVSLVNGLGGPRHRIALACPKHGGALRAQVDPSRCEGGVACLGIQRGLDLGAVGRLAALLDQRQADAVVCTNLYALAYATMARAISRRSRRAALVEVFHTTLPGSRREAWQMQGYRPLLRAADLLVYVCHAQAAHWRRRGLRARREAVIHNGIDVQRFTAPADRGSAAALRQAWGFGPQDTVVGLCAVMRPEKAHGDLLQAMHRLVLERPGLRAVLIGDGPQRAEVEAAIAARGLRERVRVTGMLDDVRPALAACDAVAITSHAVETFSIAALEAMAMGLPLVMSDLGGAREQVVDGETGWVYPPGDIAALAGCLAELSATPAEAARRGQRAALRVREHFTVDKMVARYAEALDGLTAAGQPVARP